MTEQQKGKFVGAYVDEIKNLVCASQVSGLHLILLGAPGTGKTSIARATLEAIYGDKMVFIRFNPTTSPSKVEGRLDMARLMKADSEWHIITDGTAYDPKTRVVLADEVMRASEAVDDIMLDVLDRQDVERDKAPTVVGTSNFLAQSDRSEAFLDRFALYHWIPLMHLPSEEFAEAQLASLGTTLDVGDGLPTMKEIDDIRSARATPNSIKAVAIALDNATQEVSRGFVSDEGKVIRAFGEPNNRRKAQWTQLLFRVSVWKYGTADFTEVHNDALQSLCYGWPTRSLEEAEGFKTLMGSMIDPVASAIAQALKSAYKSLVECSREFGPTERALAATRMGMVVQNHLQAVKILVGNNENDQRYADFFVTLTNSIANFSMTGKIVIEEE